MKVDHRFDDRLAVTVASARRRVARALMIAATASAPVFAAPMVTFSAVDIADVTPGQDLWRYDYTVTGPVTAFGGVVVYFSSLAYTGLSLQTADLAATPAFALDPDALGDGSATVSWAGGLTDSDLGTFSVEFVWSGSSAPGSQAFEIFDDTFAVVATGTTTAASTGGGDGGSVPEPSGLALSLAAIAGAATLGRKKSSAHAAPRLPEVA